MYIVSDPSNPENEGTVRLFKFGKKIFDKVTEAMNPEFPDEKPVNPFDLWEGANFKLKIRNVEGYRNYDKSEFADKSPLLEGDDKKLEEIWKSEHSLVEIIDKKNFKAYEVLRERLEKVLGFDGAPSPTRSKAEDDDYEVTESVGVKKVLNKEPSIDEEDLDYFKSLADV